MKKRERAGDSGGAAHIDNGNGGKPPHGPDRKRRLKLVLIALCIYFLVLTAAAVIIDARHVRFYLSGAQDMTLEYGLQYAEPGVYAVTTGRLFGEGSKRLPIDAESDIDLSRLGSYTVRYTARFLFGDYSTERRVTVTDTTPPEIELRTTDGYQSSWMTGYEEEGYTASDNYDGDLTAKVERREENDMIVYTVSDSSGNAARAERPLDYADVPPEITLLGDSEMAFTARTDFTDPGFTAVGANGADMSECVTVTGEVTPYMAGVYTLTYSITNSRGDTVSATRTVTVLPVNSPDTVDPDSKTIYLTFDDGPGPYTSGLLDILAKYNVKATFFVTGSMEKYFDQIGRAYREGHSIGVHTYSHNYKSIYASEDAFFEDFSSMQDIILEQTGSYASICRFPGGSSNTVSSFNPGIITRLSKSLTDQGYSYFDWNVSSGDAGGTTKTDKIISNIEDGCAQHKYAVVLQHDIKDYSVAAVEQVIIWGLKNDYTFRALDQSSPAVRHSIAN